MRCLMCYSPYGPGDASVESDTANADRVERARAIVYLCRVCGTERRTSLASLANVYGRTAGTDGLPALADQARRLGG